MVSHTPCQLVAVMLLNAVAIRQKKEKEEEKVAVEVVASTSALHGSYGK